MNKNKKMGQQGLNDRDILIAIPSVIIAINILYFPRKIANVTLGLDGVIGLTIGFLFILVVIFMIVLVAKSFPNEQFIDYASKLISKPMTIIFIFLFVLHGLLVSAFEIRAIAEISHLYLFDQTPIEIVGLTFLFVVIYAVSGSRLALFRLQLIFFPLVILITFFIAIVASGFIDLSFSLPLLKTDFQGHVTATFQSTLTMSGFGVIGYFLFYISLVKEPKNLTKKAIISLTWVYVIVILLFVSCILIFGKDVTTTLMFPVIELARSIEIPGDFFTRFESLLFVIWIINVFCTSIIAFDIIILGIQSIFKKVNKMKLIFFISPIIYLICSLPHSIPELEIVGDMIGYYGFFLTVITTVLLFIMLKIKGVKKR